MCLSPPVYCRASRAQSRLQVIMAKKIRIVVSLTTNDNDYQIEQAQSAEQAASATWCYRRDYLCRQRRHQSEHSDSEGRASSPPNIRPDAIVFEPVGGTALPQVARAAATAGIGWAVLNRDATYIDELRKTIERADVRVSSDHVEIGRIARPPVRGAAAQRRHRSSIYKDRRKIPRPRNAPPECKRPSRRIFKRSC